MTVTLVLSLSILLQFITAFIALRLVRITGASFAWILVSVAILLMAVRRTVSLYRLLTDDATHQPDMPAELLALTISVLMLVGIASISPLFRSMRNNQDKLEASETDARRLNEQLEQSVESRTAELAESHKALQDSKAMLARVLDTIPVGVFWKDRNSVYLGCNRRFARDSGLGDVENVVGKDDFAMSWKQQADTYRKYDREVIESGREKVIYDYQEMDQDGSPTQFHTCKVPLRDNQGNIYGVLGCYEDITERKQAEKELMLHRDHLEELVVERTRELRLQAQIIDQIHDSVVSTDLEGVVTSWNKGAERLFQYPADEAIGQNIAFVYPEEDRQFLLDEVIAPLQAKGEHEVEVRMRRKNGDDFYAHLALSMLMENGEPKGMIGYSMDITSRKRIELQLLEHRDALEAANMELEAFSYSVSHDLRTPLRAIDGFSQLLLEDCYDELDDAGKDYLDRVRSGAQHMARLIDDLLELARLGRHELAPQSVNLSELAQAAVEKLREADPDREVYVNIEPGLMASGDKRLLAIVINNLLGNAWKYTSQSSSPRIEFSSTCEDGRTVYCVRDNGVGFNMEYADKLFGTFQRLHGKEFEGTGVGLATVHRILKRHGGSVWGESSEGEGAAFYFSLPDRFIDESGVMV